jgi:hypothetical protein
MIMNEKETEKANQEQKGQNVEVEDLPVDEAQEDEVKGGDGRTYYVGTANGGVWK